MFDNDIFQLHLSGAVVCTQWLVRICTTLADRNDLLTLAMNMYFLQENGFLDKTDQLSDHMAPEVDKSCKCGLSAKYIGDSRLLCDDTSTGIVVLQARMISTDTTNSTDLLHFVSDWARQGPTVIVQGVRFTVNGHCSIYLKKFGDTRCIPIVTATPKPEPTDVKPEPTDVKPEPTDVKPKPTNVKFSDTTDSGLFPIPVIVGIVGGVLLVLVVVCVAVIAYRRKVANKHRLMLRRYSVLCGYN